MTKNRKRTLFLSLLVLTIAASPVYAQGDPVASVEGFFTTIEDLMMAVATSAAVIGFIGLAIMNLGSSIPFVAALPPHDIEVHGCRCAVEGFESYDHLSHGMTGPQSGDVGWKVPVEHEHFFRQHRQHMG